MVCALDSAGSAPFDADSKRVTPPSTWRPDLKAQGLPVPGNENNAVEWSSADSFQVVLEALRATKQRLRSIAAG